MAEHGREPGDQPGPVVDGPEADGRHDALEHVEHRDDDARAPAERASDVRRAGVAGADAPQVDPAAPGGEGGGRQRPDEVADDDRRRQERVHRRETTTPSRPGPTWAPTTAPTSETCDDASDGMRARSRSSSAVALSCAARWCTARSTGCVPRALHGDVLEPGQRLGRRADLLQRRDAPVRHVQQRLDRQRRADEGRRRADAPAAAQVLERVDVEDHVGAGGALDGGGGHRVEVAAPARGLGGGDDREAEPHREHPAVDDPHVDALPRHLGGRRAPRRRTCPTARPTGAPTRPARPRASGTARRTRPASAATSRPACGAPTARTRRRRATPRGPRHRCGCRGPRAAAPPRCRAARPCPAAGTPCCR